MAPKLLFFYNYLVLAEEVGHDIATRDLIIDYFYDYY